MLTNLDKATMGKKVATLMLAPAAGLAYVIALPFINMAAIVAIAGKMAIGKASTMLRNLTNMGWRPSEAYLSGKRKSKKR